MVNGSAVPSDPMTPMCFRCLRGRIKSSCALSIFVEFLCPKVAASRAIRGGELQPEVRLDVPGSRSAALAI